MKEAENKFKMEPVFTPDQAFAEADRCLLCFDAPCSKGCPADTKPDIFIRKLRLKNIKGAITTIKNNNIFGGICGLLCPTCNLCEKECTSTSIDRPIQIGKIQRFLVEYGWQLNFNPIVKENSNNIRIAVIGSGPSGLSCAAELAKQGFKVDVFEKRKKPGGMLRYTIPDYRLSKNFLNRELKDITNLDVKIKCNSFIKSKKDIEKLFDKGYKAVYIATGTWKSLNLGLKSNLKGFYNAADFLEKCKISKKNEITKLLQNKFVCVIGGGDAAINSAEAAKRFGAKDVSIVYRRSFKQMPGSMEEKIKALNSEIHFLILSLPVEYLSKKGKITGIKIIRNKLGPLDSSGRPKPVPIKNSEHIINTNIVIEAIGLGADDENKNLLSNIKLSKKGLIVVDEKNGETSNKNIFAGGDIVRGPSLIVEAVADGKRAAGSIMKQVRSSESVQGSKFKVQRMTSTTLKTKDLSIKFCGKKFPNPILLSSSPVSNSAEMIGRAFDMGFGGAVFKTLGTGKVDIIHPSPRMAEYNYQNKKLVGLQNVEQISDRPLKDNLADFRYLKKKWPDRILISSIMGLSLKEWEELAIASEDNGADILELNFSCPNMTVEGAGLKVGQAFKLLQKYTSAVKKVVKIPVIAKLTPNITDINEPAIYAKKGGADGIAAINTVRGLSEIGLDYLTPKPNVFGIGAISGYSGPAIKPIGLRFITELAKNEELNLPLSGIGGIETWINVLEYILCGASTVQIATSILHYGLRIIEDILEGLTYYMSEKGYNSITEMVGTALPNIQNSDKFDLKRQGTAEYDLDRCIGCGQCYIVCQDAGGQCLDWDYKKRKPVIDKKKCLSCMICSFVCPISNPPLITYKEVKNKKPVIAPVSR